MADAPSHWRRWWPLAAFCFGFGVAATVVVCWCFAALGHVFDASMKGGIFETAAYRVEFGRQDSFGLTMLCWQAEAPDPGRLRFAFPAAAEAGPVPTWSDARRLTGPDLSTPSSLRPAIFEVASGWPAKAMTASFHNFPLSVTPRPARPYVTTSGIGLRERTVRRGAIIFMPRMLPVRPIWTGFAANTAVYGGSFAVAALGLISLKRRVRARRGLCTGCGYDLRGLAGACPECGRERQ